MAWNRKLWGVEFLYGKGQPVLVGSMWHSITRDPFYLGEPTRALVFQTRKQARTWVAEKMANRSYGRFRVVRVRETVRKITSWRPL